MPGDFIFLRDECYWPTHIKKDEKFHPKWTIQNRGDDDLFWAGFRYAGVVYAFYVSRERLRKNHKVTLRTKEPVTWDEFFHFECKSLIPVEKTRTIELAFVCGRFLGDTRGTITDTWTVSTLVEVPGIPLVPIVIAAGSLGLVAYALRRKYAK